MLPPVLEEILSRGTVEAADGSVHPLLYHVKRPFLRSLYESARLAEPRLIVEIGMCHGVSSLVLAQALADTSADGTLISIDPYETELWHDIGRLNVERAGLPVELIVHDEPSHLVLPRMLDRGVAADVVFVDGNHARDYVRTDVFFSHRLLRAGGVLGLDDTKDPYIRRICTDLLTDYHYREVTPDPDYPWIRRARYRIAKAIGLPRYPRLRCFRKLDDHEPPA